MQGKQASLYIHVTSNTCLDQAQSQGDSALSDSQSEKRGQPSDSECATDLTHLHLFCTCSDLVMSGTFRLAVVFKICSNNQNYCQAPLSLQAHSNQAVVNSITAGKSKGCNKHLAVRHWKKRPLWRTAMSLFIHQFGFWIWQEVLIGTDTFVI